MGERLQVFLVARVPIRDRHGMRYGYQCVGAIHHQWCSQSMPLQALHRFFRLLRVEENAAVVREELHLLVKRQCIQGTTTPVLDFFNPAVPCPYTVSLLSTSWTIDIEDRSFLSGSSFTATLMDARKSCWDRARQLDNDEGICIIDITITERPAYCFVSQPGGCVLSAYQYLQEHGAHLFDPDRSHWEERDQDTNSDDGPLDSESTASHFAGFHFDKDWRGTVTFEAGDIDGDILHGFWALVDLAGYPLIEAAKLRDVWPLERFKDRSGPRPLRIPPTDELPMPLDIVISLYIGLAPVTDLEAFKHDLQAEEYHTAIGKAILPPYDMYDMPEESHRRISAIQRILAIPRSFEYIVDAHYPDAWAAPPCSYLGQRELLIHWSLEYERLGGSFCLLAALLEPFLTSPAYIAINLALEVVRTWIAHPVHAQLGKLCHPARVVRLLLSVSVASGRDAFLVPKLTSDAVLDLLSLTIHELNETTFLDLSGLQLTASQVVSLVQRHSGVEAISVSRNSRLASSDISFIVSSIPSLKRLHVMHMDDSDIQDVLLEYAGELRQLESLLCPILLTCPGEECPKPQIPIAFSFFHSTRVSHHYPPLLSVPFCTPAQIVQVLTDTLPHAFAESDYGESAKLCREYGSKTFLQSRRRPPQLHSIMARSYGFPFYTSASMLIHVALSSGVCKAGEPWGERRIVNLPIANVPGMSDIIGQKVGTWAFFFAWDAFRHQRDPPGKDMWAFLYCEIVRVLVGGPDDNVREEDTDTDVSPGPESTVRSGEYAWRMLPNPKVYDLRGFLRCMADEGRPLPDMDAVNRLEEILDTRDTTTGDLVCPLARPAEIPPIRFHRLTREEREEMLDVLYPAQRPGQLPSLFVAPPEASTRGITAILR